MHWLGTLQAQKQTDLMVGLIKDRKQQELTALKVA